jgi:hypothetical protein
VPIEPPRDPAHSCGQPADLVFGGFLPARDWEEGGEYVRIYLTAAMEEYLEAPRGHAVVDPGAEPDEGDLVEASLWVDEGVELRRGRGRPEDFVEGELSANTLTLPALDVALDLVARKRRTKVHSWTRDCNPVSDLPRPPG